MGYLFKDFIPGCGDNQVGSRSGTLEKLHLRRYFFGIAPYIAMVLMWSHLAKGNDGLTLIMVAINSLTMLFLYAPLGGGLLGVNAMPSPWQTILFSVLFYVALPLIAGYFSRKFTL